MCLAERSPTGSQPLCPAAECRWWLRVVEGLLLWEEGGVLYKSHPSQVCTAPGRPVSTARRHARLHSPAYAWRLSHLGAQAVVRIHVTGRGPAFLGRLEVLPAQWGLLPGGQGPTALDLAPGAECPQWGREEEDEGS